MTLRGRFGDRFIYDPLNDTRGLPFPFPNDEEWIQQLTIAAAVHKVDSDEMNPYFVATPLLHEELESAMLDMLA